MTYKVDVDNGKYTFINNSGVVDILRNGEIWSSGNKAILALLQKIERYEEALKWYADRNNYERTQEDIITGYPPEIVNEHGYKARKALQG